MTLAKAEENLETKNPLPQGWRWIRLGEVCEFAYGSSLPEIGRNKGTIPVYGSNGVVGYHDESVAQGPTLIIGRKGSIGEVNYSSGPCWPIDTTYYVDSSKTSCDLRWLFFLLKFIKLNALNKASGVPGLNRNDAYNQLIPLPSTLAEQERIARILNEYISAVEKARAAAEARLEAAEALANAYLRKAFSGSGTEGWRWLRLGEVCSFIRGVSFDNGEVRNTASEGFLPILRAGNISHSLDLINDLIWVPQAKINENQLIQKSDILICMSSGSPRVVGKTAKSKEDWSGSVGAFCGIIRAHDASTADYLSFWFRSNGYLDWRDNQARGANIQNLRFSEFEKLQVPLPLTLAKQKRIVSVLNEKMADVEIIMQTIHQELETIKALPAALLRRAFTGGL